MKYFQIRSNGSLKNVCLFEGEHRWMLSGVICPICGAWARFGEEYPCINPKKHQMAAFPGGPQSMEWYKTEFPKYNIRTPNGELARPGTSFGPLIGRFVNKIAPVDFVWGFNSILVTELIKGKLANASLKLSGFSPVELGNKKASNLFEIQVETGLSIDKNSLVRRGPDCKICGRSPLTATDGEMILQKGKEGVPDLFRAKNYATLLFATERFQAFCGEQKLTNIEFLPVNQN